MREQFQKIAVLGRHDDPRVAEPLAAVIAHLTKAGVSVIAPTSMPSFDGVESMEEASLATEADLMIAVGGDGTMLYAARIASDSGTPLLGINRGRLGFLADVTPDGMIEGLDQVLAGNYTRDTRLQLEATLESSSGIHSALGLNDIVLQRRDTGRMVDFETRVGDHYVNSHAGDGMIVATPTGSTAYALSCGGPIIEPQLNAVVIVPICPHTLTDRPIAIPADQPIVLKLMEREDARAEVTVDGRSLGEILPGDRLVIRAADERITLIHPPGYDFYGILRSKLLWGRDNRTSGT